MYEQFSDRARKVLQLANQEAQRLNHPYIGTEHILLGLVKEGSGVAFQVLTNLIINPQRIVLEVEKLAKIGPELVTMGKMPWTPAAKRVNQFANEEALTLNDHDVDTEHILLGLMREEGGVASVVLANLGLRLDDVKAEIDRVCRQSEEGEQIAEPSQSPAQGAAQTGEAPASVPNLGLRLDELRAEIDSIHRQLFDRRFTERARKALQLAEQEAARLGHEYVGTAHILLGLLKEGGGTVVIMLTKRGIDPQKVVSEIERLLPLVPEIGLTSNLPRTPRAKTVLGYAAEEARNLGHRYVGTEHILLGLLREAEGVAAQVLMSFGLRLEGVRAEFEIAPAKPIKPQPPAQANETAALPEACPKCGQPVVRVIWELSGKNLEDVQTGRAILGSPVDKGGPSWVCLHCSPKWAEVHLLGLEEHKLQVEKENALVAQDFDKAAQCRDRQSEVRRKTVILLIELLREK
jgi:ATP-dependent Clp protease ATP-binding subunit ClpA